MRVADYLMERLHSAGVRRIFLVTGRGALFLTDAVAKHEGIEAVCMHHEQSAAFAAIGSAQATDTLGACLVSTGCAATNAITGVLSAWQDGVPCVFISGQNTLAETTRHTGIALRTYGQQEADIVSLVKPITKYAAMLTRAADIVPELEKALALATSGRKGPVWLDIPLDLQSSVLAPPGPSLPERLQPLAPSAEEIQTVAEALAAAQRPVVLIGSGVRAAGAREALARFVERWNLPVTYAASAPDTYGSARSLCVGSVGAMGCSRAGNFAVQNADLILVLGCRLTSLTTGTEPCKFARAARVLVVNIDPAEHAKATIAIDRLVTADAGAVLAALEALPPSLAPEAWVDRCRHWKTRFAPVEPAFTSPERVDLYVLAEALSEALPATATLVTDSGSAEVILPTNVRFGPGMACVHPASQGAMGYALPAAIGACCARPEPTIAVIGDGSIMMNLQELETVRYRQLPIKILVINNNAYSIIRRRQQGLFRTRTIGTDPDNGVSCPNFHQVAGCFGLTYRRIDGPDGLVAALEAVFAEPGPVLCEIMGRPDQGYIELGHTRSEVTRRVVRRPLEDQAPFLDRAEFLAEMIVEPIDQ